MAHILVVDDEEPLRKLIKEVMMMNGHTCDLASNGLEALERIRKTPYDLVIIDRNMPTMDGIQTVALLRSNPQYQSLKVLMCTSVSVAKEVDEAFTSGVTDYVLKPFTLQALANKVKNLLAPQTGPNAA
jgi:hypothetical protein